MIQPIKEILLFLDGFDVGLLQVDAFYVKHSTHFLCEIILLLARMKIS